MDPVTAALLIGSFMVSKQQADQQQAAMQSAKADQEKAMVENQNRMVEDKFKKNRQARGLGQQVGPAGNLSSQSGSVLTSATDGNASSLV